METRTPWWPLIVVLVVTSCGREEPKQVAAESTSKSERLAVIPGVGADSGPEPAPARAGSARLADLAGRWRGTSSTSSRGSVTATATVSPRGAVAATVITGGTARTVAFQILRWTGTELVVSDGQRRLRVDAALVRDGLRIRTAATGTVILHRVRGE